jgi:hypothetical protein
MTEDTQVKTRRKPRPKYNPDNKEQASYKPKKKRWKKHHKKPKKDLGKSLLDLQEHFNDKYHAS